MGTFRILFKVLASIYNDIGMKLIFLYTLLLAFHFSSKAQNEGLINSNGSKLHYKIYGKGLPILVINGGPGMNSDGFASLAIQLSNNYQVILYDQRGTGKSILENPNASNVTISLMIEDIENLRKHLKIDNWIILGHSFGGMLASYYATIYPENIKSLILSSSGGIDLDLLTYVSKNINSKIGSTKLDSITYLTNKINKGDTSYSLKLQRGTLLAPAYVFYKKNVAVIAERLTQSNLYINQLVWQDLRKIEFDCTDKLSTFNKPVLIIQGKQDIVEERTARKEQHAFKNSKLILLDNCVHYGWLDRPDEYFFQLNKFIQSN